jgi:hypothetical protein
LTAGLAGCSGLLGENGNDDEFTGWLPAPGELTRPGSDPTEEFEHYTAVFNDVQPLRDDDVEVPAYPPAYASTAGVAVDDVETATLVSPLGVVFTGNFDAESVTDELDRMGHTEESEHEGFTIHAMEREDEGEYEVVGVSDDAVVLSLYNPIDAGTGFVEAVIDARNENVDRYAEASEDFDLLMNDIGTGVYRTAETHPEVEETAAADAVSSTFDGQVAQGTAMRIDGDTIRQTSAKVFTDADTVPSEDLASWVEEYEDERWAFGRFEEFSTEESGRVWTVSGSLKPSVLTEDSADTPTSG